MTTELPPIALIAALDVEAQAVARRLARAAVSSPQVGIWDGEIEDTRVVLAVSGVGKVAAALATQFLCDVYRPRLAITFGLAGATESNSQAGRGACNPRKEAPLGGASSSPDGLSP